MTSAYTWDIVDKAEETESAKPGNPSMPTVYIDDFVGVSIKLETLPMAFAIRKAFGHEIVLGWPELDSFGVEENHRGSVRVLARIGATRVRCCDDRLFDSLRRKKIILRSLGGPAYRLDPIYLEFASRVRLDRVLSRDIRSTDTREPTMDRRCTP